jgi:hypothetical protein
MIITHNYIVHDILLTPINQKTKTKKTTLMGLINHNDSINKNKTNFDFI